MSIICSCGHKIEDYDEAHSITCKSEALGENGYQKALSYQTVCGNCYQEYKQEGLVFENDEEAFKWINKGDW